MSPDGIYLLAGDPSFPQAYCHFPLQFEGPTTLPAGSTLMNMKPTADRIADHYFKQLAPQRIGPCQLFQRRQRPDVVQAVFNSVRRMGVRIPRKFQLTAVEVPFQIQQNGVTRVGSMLATAGFAGEYTMGMWAFWDGNAHLYVAPPHLAAQAEQARMRMIETYQITPRMYQIVQQDEAIITANSQAANEAQWNWFAGQQAAHRTQESFGDMIVGNYWQQQQANDVAMRGWEQTQSVYDRASQNYSDAQLGNQRLADDAMGKSYDAPAGYNYYWLDQQTGQVHGTNTSDPPDYQRNFTPLRKM